MDNTQIISIVSFIIVVLFLFFAGFLLAVKTKNKLSNVLLASFLIVTAIDIGAFFYHYFIEIPPFLKMLRIQLFHFKNPLLFLYYLSLIYANFKLRWVHALTVIPWLVAIGILIPNFFLVTLEEQQQFLFNYANNKEIRIIDVFSNVVDVMYIALEIYYILRYRKLLLENYTGKGAFGNYRWVKQLFMLSLIGYVLTSIKGYIRDHGDFEEELVNVFRIIMLAFGVFFSFWLVFKALLKPKLFRGIDGDLQLSKDLQISDTSNTKSNEKIEHLKSVMGTEEPYLNPALTVKELAEIINIPHRELSVLINQELGQHFFDFVNSYRIEKAKSLLKDPSKKKFTVLEILYEVGFNSKSSFNTAFKKHTGTTPTSYRKSQ